MSLYKKLIKVPMTYAELMRLTSWLRTRIEKGASIENIKLMIAFVDRLEVIGKKARIQDDKEIMKLIGEKKIEIDKDLKNIKL